MGKSKSGKSEKRKKDKGIVEETRVVIEERVDQNPAGHVVGENVNLPGDQAPEIRPDGQDDAEASNAARGNVPVMDGTGATVDNPSVLPSAQEQWEAMKAMMAQMAILTETLVPEPVVLEKEAPKKLKSVIVELDPPTESSRKRGDYLSLLEHVSRLGTKHFTGSVDPIVADEWRSRLLRNFNSTRCPEDYRVDIAVHFLEGDAHNWWLSVEKRKGDEIQTFADFELEFNKKYFPPEAWDRMECAYLELVQGNRTVREYDEAFNRLRRYVGRELEEEQAQVRRFIRGLRVEIRNHCLIRTFNSVSELVERAAMIEIGIEEQKEVNRAKFQPRNNPAGKPVDKKRKAEPAEDSKSEGKRGECATCGRRHGGECWKAIGACARCGSKDHEVRNCPKPRRNTDDPRACYLCGKTGHVRRNCPDLNEGDASAPKRQAVAPRVYELSEETGGAGNFHAVTGKFRWFT